MREPLGLRITEVFTSLQGEALTSGLPTTFIRLTGCPLRVCTATATMRFRGGTQRSVADLVNTSKTSGANLGLCDRWRTARSAKLLGSSNVAL